MKSLRWEGWRLAVVVIILTHCLTWTVWDDSRSSKDCPLGTHAAAEMLAIVERRRDKDKNRKKNIGKNKHFYSKGWLSTIISQLKISFIFPPILSSLSASLTFKLKLYCFGEIETSLVFKIKVRSQSNDRAALLKDSNTPSVNNSFWSLSSVQC